MGIILPERGGNMSSDKWKRENTKVYQLRLTINTDLYRSLIRAIEEERVAEGAYLRIALEEKLIRDGYLTK